MVKDFSLVTSAGFCSLGSVGFSSAQAEQHCERSSLRVLYCQRHQSKYLQSNFVKSTQWLCVFPALKQLGLRQEDENRVCPNLVLFLGYGLVLGKG